MVLNDSTTFFWSLMSWLSPLSSPSSSSSWAGGS